MKKVELVTKRPVEGLISGNYHSVFKGRGIEFSEVREYVPGDDIRTIDWNVSARMNGVFVKEFIEERDLSMFIMFDMSASGNFGSVKSKKETGIEVAASLMVAALRNNDNIGLCLFTDHVERFFRPKKGRRHMLRMVRELVSYEPKEKKTDLKKSLGFASNIIKRKSILFIISDFMADDFEKPLAILRKRHDVILVRVRDSHESSLPDVGYIHIEDEETGEQLLINTKDIAFMDAFSAESKVHDMRLEKIAKRLSVGIISVCTNQPFHVPLNAFFTRRRKR